MQGLIGKSQILKNFILTILTLCLSFTLVFGGEASLFRLTKDSTLATATETGDRGVVNTFKSAATKSMTVRSDTLSPTDTATLEQTLKDSLVKARTHTVMDSASRVLKDAARSLDSTALALDSITLAAGGKVVRNGKESMLSDSTALQRDSIAADTLKPRKAGLDAPVQYEAKDSMVYDGVTGFAYLYGKAKINYTDMQLEAAQITMNMDSNLVHANAFVDTTGVLHDKPQNKQGGDEYNSENMSFNFKTKKGFIGNVATKQGNGYVQSRQSKRTDDGTLYIAHATYSTCDAEHPHFYLALSRGKIRPGKETIFGPAYLVVEDVPLPLAIPYGFFPINRSYSSGFIMPTYGDETSRGFYLREGGYYFALNDYLDFKVLGEIYTKGSWGLSFESTYNKRYRYRGNFYFNYLNTVEGERNMPDYSVTKSIKLQWSHTKDAKASPNTTFSARVNFASESFERKNLTSMYNPLAYTQSVRSSSVSFSHNFTKIGLSISASTNMSQNMRDSTISMTLPDLSINLARFYPFRRKKQAGKERWYEKISLSYTGSMRNSISTKEDKLLKSNLVKDWTNGMQHRIPIDATFQLFKYLNITPSFTLRDYMYSRKVMRSWDTAQQKEVQDTVYGFYNLYDWNMSVSANTTLYGFYKPLLFSKKILNIRHVIKPSISFTYAPDFTTASYGYMDSYDRIDASGNVTKVQYSPYQGGIYGYPSGTRQGMISMSLSNNLEMKVKSERDSTGEKKISLIDELSGTLSYNMAAKEKPWSDLSTRLRLKISKSYTFSMAAVFATYAYEFNDKGQVIVGNTTEWSHGRFGRFQGMSQNLSYTLNNEKLSRLFNWILGKGSLKDKSSQQNKNTNEDNEEYDDAADSNIDPDMRNKHKGTKKKQKAKVDDDGYLTFSMPWSITFSYGITMYEDRTKEINKRRMRYPYSFTQTLNFHGNIRIAEGWNIDFRSGYDFNSHQLSMTTASLSRDLHCFEMSCSIVLRPYSSFNFSFRAKANELADALKWDKRSSYSSNIDWY